MTSLAFRGRGLRRTCGGGVITNAPVNKIGGHQ